MWISSLQVSTQLSGNQWPLVVRNVAEFFSRKGLNGQTPLPRGPLDVSLVPRPHPEGKGSGRFRHISWGYFKTWTVDRGLDHGLDYGPNSVASSKFPVASSAYISRSWPSPCADAVLYIPATRLINVSCSYTSRGIVFMHVDLHYVS